MRRTHIGTVLVVLLLLVAGCSGAQSGGGGAADPSLASSGGDGGGNADAAVDAEATAAGSERAENQGSSGAAAAVQADRAIIRTGHVSLTVASFESAREGIAQLARQRGGYVATSSRNTNGEGNRTWTTGRVVIRVPSEEFAGSFDEVERLGTVRESSADTQDVTDQLVDIEARLETLREERARLRELYQQANETETVLRISEELSDVQTEIERLTARKKNLEERVALSTITVELREEPPERSTPTPKPGYADTGLVTAFLASIDGVVTAIKAVGVTVAYALPYLLAFGVPLGGLAVAFARLR